MNLRESQYVADWKAGILFFEDVTSGTFNELHCTVTTSAAAVGQGFHFSSYQRGSMSVGMPTGHIYFLYNGGSGGYTKLNSTNPSFADSGVLQNFEKTFFFSLFMDPSLVFYRKCFGLAAPRQQISANDFPALGPSAKLASKGQTIQSQTTPTPPPVRQVALVPSTAATNGGAVGLNGGPQEQEDLGPYPGFGESILRALGI